MRLSHFISRYRKAILLLVVLLCAIGAYFSRNLPVAIFPDLTAPRIIVTADAGDTPIPTLLANVTRPLENAVAGVPNITRIESLTQRGSDELSVNFDPKTDMQLTLQLVNAQLARVQSSLPPGVRVTAERLNPSVFPVMGYSLYSKTVSPRELRRLALYTLRPRLLRVPGVQQIAVLGGDTPNYLVQVDSAALLARGLTIQNVQDALSKTNEVASVGFYDQSYLHNQILISGLFKGAQDIANVTVSVKNRVPVTVGQVASVQPGVEKRVIETTGDGQDAVLMQVVKQPAGNTVQVADGIRAALAEAKSALPPDVTVSLFYDQSQIVQASQASVLEAILVGGVLALIVVTLFLGNLRTAAVVLIILPLTILISFALMKALGQTMNIMTLGALAIALGLVIDDGIVVVENMFHELESGKERKEAIAAGLQAITPAMVGSSLTTMAAFLPLTFLTGITGQFFGPLALVMIATLGASLALALLLTPLLAEWLLPAQIAPHAPAKRGGKDHAPPKVGLGGRVLGFFPRLFTHVIRFYGNTLGWCLKRRTAVLLLLLPVGIGSYFLLTNLQTGFFPEFDEGDFVLDYQLPAGTSLAQSSATAGQIEGILAKTPEVVSWSRRTGAGLGFDITTQNRGDMSVHLKTDRTRDIQAIMDDVRQQVEAEVPAAAVDPRQILQDNIGDIAGSPSPVQVKIFGPDTATLETLANQVNDILGSGKIAGAVDNNNGIVNSSPETVLDVNPERAQRYGLTTDDIKQALNAAVLGVEPTTIQQGEEAVGVRVVLAHGSQPLDQSAISRIPVASPVTGGLIPLSEVATLTPHPGTLQATREDQRQMIAVTSNISGRDLGSVTSDVQKVVAKQVKLPPGYTIEYGGLYASQQQSFSELASVLGLALLFVFTLLTFQFRALRQAAALLLAAVLSLSGVLLALFLTKTPLNISSFTGAIMIIGIITENGIVLFDFFNHLHKEAPSRPLPDLLREAGEQRLRPILMTTLGAILALLPLALGLGAGAALQKPLAIAVIGGLSVSTLFTLLVAPVLYVTLEGLTRRRGIR